MGYYKLIFVLLKPLEHKCSETHERKGDYFKHPLF